MHENLQSTFQTIVDQELGGGEGIVEKTVMNNEGRQVQVDIIQITDEFGFPSYRLESSMFNDVMIVAKNGLRVEFGTSERRRVRPMMLEDYQAKFLPLLDAILSGGPIKNIYSHSAK